MGIFEKRAFAFLVSRGGAMGFECMGCSRLGFQYMGPPLFRFAYRGESKSPLVYFLQMVRGKDYSLYQGLVGVMPQKRKHKFPLPRKQKSKGGGPVSYLAQKNPIKIEIFNGECCCTEQLQNESCRYKTYTSAENNSYKRVLKKGG